MAVRCLRCHAMPPTFLICDLVYQTPIKTYQSQIQVACIVLGHVTTKYQTPTRHTLLGHRKHTYYYIQMQCFIVYCECLVIVILLMYDNIHAARELMVHCVLSNLFVLSSYWCVQLSHE